MSSRLVNWGISITGGSTIIINSTQPSTFTNITAASIVGTDISTGTINASTGITSSSLLVTNLVSTNTSLGNLTSLTGTFANKVGTNQTVGTINVTTGITSSALLITGLASVSNLFSTNGSITNLILISGSIGSLSTGNISVSGNMTVGGNLLVQGSLISVNITSVNVVDTNITAGTLNATLASIGNLITTNISTGTLRASANVAIGSNTATYNLDVTGTTRITNTTATSMGTLIVAGPGSTGYLPATATSGQLASFYGPGGAGTIVNYDLSTFQPVTGTNNLPSARISMLDLGGINSTFNILTKNNGATGTMASRIMIDGSGNVGIGTSNPSNILTVNGNIQNTGYTFITSATAAITTSTRSSFLIGSTNNSGPFMATIYVNIGDTGSNFHQNMKIKVINNFAQGLSTPAVEIIESNWQQSSANCTVNQVVVCGATGTYTTQVFLNVGAVNGGTVTVSTKLLEVMGDVPFTLNTPVSTATSGNVYTYSIDNTLSAVYGVGNQLVLARNTNVGINTSAPVYTLDISSSLATDSVRITNTNTGGYATIAYKNNNNMQWIQGVANSVDATFGGKWYVISPNGVNNSIVGTTAGNWGINTANPESALHVTGTRAGAPTTKGIHMGEGGTNDYAIEICAANATSNAYIDFTSPSNDFKGRILYNLSSNVMQFFTNTTNYMTLGSTGNLDITGNVSISGTQLSMANGTNNTIVFTSSGVTGPTQTVNGGVGCKLSLWPGSIGASVPYAIGVEGNNVWYASGGGGHKWYNTTTTASMQLTGSNLIVTGDITAFGSISDINLKTNITPVSLGLTTTLALNPVTFNWKDNIFNVEKRGLSDVGFIAQEVEQLIPQAVGQFTTPDGKHVYKNLKHERILPYTVSAIQELNAKIEKQQTVIDSLLERLAIIEAL